MVRFQPNASIMRAFVLQMWGEEAREHTNKRGTWLSVPSPWRSEDTKRLLGFNLDSKWVHDFYLGESWSFIKFIQNYHGLSSYREAIRWIVEYAKTNNLLEEGMFAEPDPAPVAQPIEEAPSFAFLPEIAYPPATVPIDLSIPDPFIAKAAAYLAPRVTQEEIEFYGIRYCMAGHFGGRIILPVKDEFGRFVWFQGRTIVGSEPKYLNPNGDEKSQLVFNLHVAQPGEPLVLCEGAFDAMRARGGCIFGKSLSLYQLTKIKRRGVTRIVLALDADPPGVEGTLKTAELLEKHGIGFSVVLYPSGHKDFGDMSREDVVSTIADAVPWNERTKGWIRMALLLVASRFVS